MVGGFLTKYEHTSEFWEYVEENLNSTVALEDNERCLKIIHMSFKQLPVHLKPCFLYMGVFAEDHVLSVSTLIRLWVSEGFLKPVNGKSLEETAKEYLKDIIARNLIMDHGLGSTGNLKYCKIHDLVRDLCLIEAEKERFYNVVRPNTPRGSIDAQRRIVVSVSSYTAQKEMIDGLQLQPMSLARSLIWDLMEAPPPLSLRLLRIFHSGGAIDYPEYMFHFLNSRYLAYTTQAISHYIPSSIYRFWNLQTLIVDNACEHTAPAEIWYMSQIRHIKFGLLKLADPPRVAKNAAQKRTGTSVKKNVTVVVNFQKLGIYHMWTLAKGPL